MHRLVRTYYRSLTPDGKLWAETRDPRDIRNSHHPTEKLTYEKLEVYEVSGKWDSWDPSGTDQPTISGEIMKNKFSILVSTLALVLSIIGLIINFCFE